MLYRRLPRLLEEMEIAREDGSLLKLRQQLMKAKLLVLNDWCVSTLEIVDDRVASPIHHHQLPTAG